MGGYKVNSALYFTKMFTKTLQKCVTLNYSFLRPYRFKLALISELFEPGFISKSEEYGFSGDLDAEALKTMFNSVAQDIPRENATA